MKSFLQSRFLTLISLTTVSLFFLFLFRIPVSKSYFYGDDFLVFEANQTRWGYSSNFMDSWTQVSSGKYRPLFTPVLNILFDLNANNYLKFYYFQLFLLAVLSTVFASIAFQLTNKRLIYVLSPIILISSRFTWYNQSEIHGIMESLAAIWLLTGIYLMLKWIQKKQTIFLPLSSISLMFALFTHERYLIVPIFLFLAITFLIRTNTIKNVGYRFTIFLLMGPILNYVFKSLIFGIDILQGGGETPLRGSIGVWIILHGLFGVLGILGFSTGKIDFFSTDALRLIEPLGQDQYLQRWIGLGIVSLTFLLIFFFGAEHRRSENNFNKNYLFVARIILLSVIFSSLLPAATVISRTEGRWLQVPEFCMWLIIITFIPTHFKKTFHLMIGILLIGNLSLAITSRQSLDEYLLVRKIPQDILQAARDNAPKSGTWNLTVAGENIPTWGLGYGRAFSQLVNPPTSVGFYEESCKSPCLRIDVSSTSVSVDWIFPKSWEKGN